jgi:hypothetical protein
VQPFTRLLSLPLRSLKCLNRRPRCLQLYLAANTQLHDQYAVIAQNEVVMVSDRGKARPRSLKI